MNGRVLVVDDDDDIRAILAVSLGLAGFDVVEARDGVEGLDTAQRMSPDAIVLDVMMPRLDGLSMLEQLRADPRLSHVPVIMLTARAQPGQAAEGLRAGADDYLAKPFDSHELVARIESSIRRADQHRSRNPLTGLPGNEQILTELQRRLERQEPLALLYADLDDFKAYNDYYGFMRGDQALQRLAQVLRTATDELPRDRSFVGHVGGDDFVAVVEPPVAQAVAERVCVLFDELSPLLYDPEDRQAGGIVLADRQGDTRRFGFLTVSVGIATTDRTRYDHHGQMIAVATEMKRYAKRLDADRSSHAMDRRRSTRGLAPAVDEHRGDHA